MTGGVDVGVATPVEDQARRVGAELGEEEPPTETETSHTDLQLMDFLLSHLFIIAGRLGRLNRISNFMSFLRRADDLFVGQLSRGR